MIHVHINTCVPHVITRHAGEYDFDARAFDRGGGGGGGGDDGLFTTTLLAGARVTGCDTLGTADCARGTCTPSGGVRIYLYTRILYRYDVVVHTRTTHRATNFAARRPIYFFVPVSGDAAAVRSFIIAAAVVTAHPYRSFRRCRLVSPPTSVVYAAVRRQQHQQQQQQQRVRHRRPLSLPLTPPRSQWSVAPPSARSPRTAVAVAVVVAVFVVVVVPIANVFVVVVVVAVAVIAAPPSFSTAVAVAVAAFALSNGGRTSPRSQSYYHSGTSAAAIINYNRLVEKHEIPVTYNISTAVTATTGTASTTTASTTSAAAATTTSVASSSSSTGSSRTTAAILLLLYYYDSPRVAVSTHTSRCVPRHHPARPS